MTRGRPAPLTDAQAAILVRIATGATLTRSLLGHRLWSLLEDPFTVFDDVSPRLLCHAGWWFSPGAGGPHRHQAACCGGRGRKRDRPGA